MRGGTPNILWRRGFRAWTGVYINNLNADDAARVPEAYGPNYERLAAIKRKYDPDNSFRINHNIR